MPQQIFTGAEDPLLHAQKLNEMFTEIYEVLISLAVLEKDAVSAGHQLGRGDPSITSRKAEFSAMLAVRRKAEFSAMLSAETGGPLQRTANLMAPEVME
jgi:hypothetical protein